MPSSHTAPFTKRSTQVSAHFFPTEAAGLKWLEAARGARVARVMEVGEDHLSIEKITSVSPTLANASALGEALHRTHKAGADYFGSKPPEAPGDNGFIGPTGDALPMPYGEWNQWGTYFADARIAPYVDMLEHQGLTSQQHDIFERLIIRLKSGDFDDTHRPARLHGDLWSGNLLWSQNDVVLIDPAACGGHPLDDLAMLALFSAPYIDTIFSHYAKSAQLEADWQQRLPLHQIYPLLVHGVLFGASYVQQAVRVAQRFAG
ncbi:putative ketoamine kinase [Halomonadaceae bacterium LMG 33818]|uniref:fructosamine kinase family protein n=1 Tax=Cernens ardua TaxID=3402176 RepID=UPI003EDB71B0